MELTRAEEQIMQILWRIEKGFVKDILENFIEPKPAYTTVATILKILEKKEFVSHKAYGNSYQFFPLISKEQYSKYLINSVIRRHYKTSIRDIVSSFVDNNEIEVKDIDEAIKLLNDLKKRNS
ncbi:MAG TPA: BlaI/MecI/CopY family transcriptional regulator [Bacteroidales bacterium]|nr:BlaI/MecI/CopY family transcriptional regulator [Bacteroidales bacterium]